MKPGATTRPCASIVRVAVAFARLPMRAIRSPLIARSPLKAGRPEPSTMRPLLISRSYCGVLWGRVKSIELISKTPSVSFVILKFLLWAETAPSAQGAADWRASRGPKQKLVEKFCAMPRIRQQTSLILSKHAIPIASDNLVAPISKPARQNVSARGADTPNPTQLFTEMKDCIRAGQYSLIAFPVVQDNTNRVKVFWVESVTL